MKTAASGCSLVHLVWTRLQVIRTNFQLSSITISSSFCKSTTSGGSSAGSAKYDLRFLEACFRTRMESIARSCSFKRCAESLGLFHTSNNDICMSFTLRREMRRTREKHRWCLPGFCQDTAQLLLWKLCEDTRAGSRLSGLRRLEKRSDVDWF